MPPFLLSLFLAAPPTDVVQTHDLGTMTWQRAKALEGRRVRVRFTVSHLGWAAVPSKGTEAVLIMAVGPEREWRLVGVKNRDVPALKVAARLEAEGVLRVTWCAADSFSVELTNARLAK